ncbi:NAD kinase [Flavobacteriaceae bacterium]|jgi:NAD+ kinase|nr:NAD kinase [Flavobacteriaceae bacterium]MDA9029849.1 NAD kinase [Flavobacteriaceae bacterium]|tara:strand:- start:106 stop:987 length:882 start_codon:yes stop_codon:yes gene_type:complete
MKIAVYGPLYNERSKSTIKILIEYLKTQNADVFFEKDFYESVLKNSNIDIESFRCDTFKSLDTSFELLISIGGDGTILRAITYVKDLNIPIVGINTGRLGFLATIPMNTVEKALNEIFDGNYRISKRSLLAISIDEGEAVFDLNFALNEITVSRKNTTSMISVETWLDDEYLTSYWADGLIVSTPTGSTGYSLSCGGPVIMPESDSLVLTPIAPHNLNARPLVISSNKIIKLKVSGREDEHLVSLDSRIKTLPNNTTITIQKAPFNVHMIELKDERFIETLRKKLLWGADQRN